jgi:hypothetical protein
MKSPLMPPFQTEIIGFYFKVSIETDTNVRVGVIRVEWTGPTTLRHVRCTANSSRIALRQVVPAETTRAALSRAASVSLGAFDRWRGAPADV